MADSPKEAEVAQAMFCYLADFIGAVEVNKEWADYINGKISIDDESINKFFAKKYNSKTYESIIDSALGTQINTAGLNLKIIRKFFISQGTIGFDWFKSSLKIGQVVLQQVGKINTKLSSTITPAGWSNIFYVRGDNEIMGKITECFNSANKQSAGKLINNQSFGNLNKWSPADIYFASKKAKDAISELANNSETKKNNLTFSVLNTKVGNLIKNGDLLPLSLKKVVGVPKLEKVNFVRKKEEELIAETSLIGVEKFVSQQLKIITKPKYKLEYPVSKRGEGTRDIYLNIKSQNTKGYIQFRHVPASGGKAQNAFKTILSYQGASAFGGSIGSFYVMAKVASTVDTNFAAKIRTQFDNSYKTFISASNVYLEKVGNKLYKDNKKDQFNEDMGALSGYIIMNDLRKIISEYFSIRGEKQNNVVRAIFAYLSARSTLSSPFVIAKD
jgi:hypothetical protein